MLLCPFLINSYFYATRYNKTIADMLSSALKYSWLWSQVWSYKIPTIPLIKTIRIMMTLRTSNQTMHTQNTMIPSCARLQLSSLWPCKWLHTRQKSLYHHHGIRKMRHRYTLLIEIGINVGIDYRKSLYPWVYRAHAFFLRRVKHLSGKSFQNLI